MEHRFANYKYHGRNINNLGDHLQIITIDYLYEQMGLSRDEIVYIDLDDLSTYNGVQVYLPVSMPLINQFEHGVADMFSPKITPVFFGLTMPKEILLPEEIEYYKKYEPIGCRDEQAYNTMVKYGVKAYLGGCITISLPKRNLDLNNQKKIFIVDVPEKLKSYIPPDISMYAEWNTHIFYGNVDNPKKLAEERYQRYKNEACLMITGLLHAAVPCLAYGIPVILARDCVSYRFAWLESLLPIYDENSFGKINWSPEVADIENHKKIVKDLFAKRMKGQDANNEIQYLHNFYMNRNRSNYKNDVFIEIQEFIDKTWLDKDKKYEYSVWGLTQIAEVTVDYISKKYPNAKLTHVYDKRPGLAFMGMKSIEPENIEKFPDETVFVTTVSAATPAKELFDRVGKAKNLYQITTIVR